MKEELNFNTVIDVDCLRDDYTNEQWQKDFAELKKSSLVSDESQSDCNYPCDSTNSYEIFLESILYTIRHGEVDRCYCVSQIADLLRYEKNLQVKYVPREKYFRVWL